MLCRIDTANVEIFDIIAKIESGNKITIEFSPFNFYYLIVKMLVIMNILLSTG